MLPGSRRRTPSALPSRGRLIALVLVLSAPGCRMGYEVLDDMDSVGLGGQSNSGDGDGELPGDGDGDATGGVDASGGAPGSGGSMTSTGSTHGAGGDPGTGGAATGGAGTGGTASGGSGTGGAGTGGAGTGGAGTGGSATGGAGTGGAGTGGAGTGGSGGTSAGCGVDAFFCTGFEDPLLAEWTDSETAHATCIVETSTSQVFAESNSLYTFAPSNRDTARVNYAFDTAVLSGPLSLRAWFFVPSTVTMDDDIVILELHDDYAGAQNKASINLGTGDTIVLEATTGISPPASVSAGAAFNRDAWNCAVLRADVSDAGSLAVEINGTQVLSISGGDVLPPTGFSRALVGLYKLGNSDVEIYFDQVELAQAALTCP